MIYHKNHDELRSIQRATNIIDFVMYLSNGRAVKTFTKNYKNVLVKNLQCL